MAMDSFAGKLAVVTGVGSGMGRELTRQTPGPTRGWSMANAKEPSTPLC